MYAILRFVLFLLPAEWAHQLCLSFLSVLPLGVLTGMQRTTPLQPCEQMGLKFSNPVGLAAGLDKDGEAIDAWLALGFGFVEVGTVTPNAQLGNPKPRLFRIPEAEALINRMGFNNRGVDNLVSNLKRRRLPGIVGVNIGKNKDTPLDQALEDYQYCFDKVYPFADYVTVNLSSPNTPGLRELQQGQYLENLVSALKAQQQTLAQRHKRYVPLLIKIAPDLSDEELREMVDCFIRHQIDGVVATNTTLDHSVVTDFENGSEAGGLSGNPLKKLSNNILAKLKVYSQDRFLIVGVGGIFSAEDAKEKKAMGADLVQLYTGLIYRGPGLIREVVGYFTGAKMRDDGVGSNVG